MKIYGFRSLKVKQSIRFFNCQSYFLILLYYSVEREERFGTVKFHRARQEKFTWGHFLICQTYGNDQSPRFGKLKHFHTVLSIISKFFRAKKTWTQSAKLNIFKIKKNSAVKRCSRCFPSSFLAFTAKLYWTESFPKFSLKRHKK